MSWSDIMSHFEGVLLILMWVIFCAIAGWAYSPRMRRRLDEDAQIPLREDR